jgi:hypothetical protein
MGNEIVANGALVATLLALAIRELFSWLKEKSLQTTDNKIVQINNSLKSITDRVEKVDIKIDMANQMNKTMFDWHDKSDEDGVKIWYVRRSLEEAINILAKNSDMQTRLLEDMVRQNKEISKDQIILSKLLERLIDKQ